MAGVTYCDGYANLTAKESRASPEKIGFAKHPGGDQSEQGDTVPFEIRFHISDHERVHDRLLIVLLLSVLRPFLLLLLLCSLSALLLDFSVTGMLPTNNDRKSRAELSPLPLKE